MPKFAIMSMIPSSNLIVVDSALHSITTGWLVCPHTSKGNLLAALAVSLVIIIPIPKDKAKSQSRALTSAPESISARNVKCRILHLILGDEDLSIEVHGNVDNCKVDKMTENEVSELFL